MLSRSDLLLFLKGEWLLERPITTMVINKRGALVTNDLKKYLGYVVRGCLFSATHVNGTKLHT